MGRRGSEGELSVLVGGVSGRSASHISCVVMSVTLRIGWVGEGIALDGGESGKMAFHMSSVVT